MKTKFSNFSSYARRIIKALNSAMVYENGSLGKPLDKKEAWGKIADILKSSCANGGKIMFIGNGGSAAIASHMALDFTNAGKLRAVCFNDGAMLTCLANDYSFEKVFEKAVEAHADRKDVLVAISSSGESKNILNGVLAAKRKGCKAITFSGFNSKNPLMRLGDLNVHLPIPSPSYGLVEVCHYNILHFILDSIK